MGRLDHESVIMHGSHPHPLSLSSTSEGLAGANSACCGEPPHGWTYSCKHCLVFLHLDCVKSPPLIQHPFHPHHPLSLLLTPAYPQGFFNCDACGRPGTGFSYHCGHCHVDLHAKCAAAPLVVSHVAHPHPLTLAFVPPYASRGFACDVCRHIGGNHWLYRCASCEFDVHLGCARSNVPSVTHGPSQHAWPQQGYHVAVAPSPVYQKPNPVVAQGAPMNNTYYNNNVVTTNDVVGTAVLGFVDGAAQQVGQTFAESVLGAFCDNGGQNGGDDGA